MGDINPSKMPKAVKKARRDNTDFTQYKEGGKVGLYENIHKKQARIKAGSGEKIKNWIADAIKKPGALRKELGAKAGKPIPSAKLAAAAKKPGKVGKRARLAETLKGFKK